MSEEVAELAQASLDAEAFEEAALAYLDRAIGADVAMFSLRDGVDPPTTRGFEAADARRVRARAAIYGEELLPVKRAALARGGVATDTEVLGPARLRKRYFRELAAPLGGRHSLIGVLQWRGVPSGMVMLGRVGRAFDADEQARLARALPAIGVARTAFGAVFEPQPEPLAPRGWSARVGDWLDERLGGERVIAEVRGQAATLVVRDRAGQREMVAQDAEGEMVWTRVALDDPARSGWPYVDLLHLAATRARRRRRALFVGLGGGVAMRQFARTYPGIRLDVVERDPMVVALARAHFRLDDIPQLRVVVEDGARFVRRAPAAHWDVVVVDAYDAGRPAADMAQRPFFAALHRATRPGGAVAINLVSALDAPSLGQLVHRLSRRFDDVRLAPVVVANERYRADARRNVVVTAVRR